MRLNVEPENSGSTHDVRQDQRASRLRKSRREFLGTMAAASAVLGASPLMPVRAAAVDALASFAQAVSPPRIAKTGRIDVHQHFFPPFYMKFRQAQVASSGRPDRSNWTPESAIEGMDKNGIATGFVSLPIYLTGDSLNDRSETARKLARQSNEYGAQMAKDYPGRFGVFAALPLPDQDGSLREIEYALDTLKADGIGLWTSYVDKWPGDPVFEPVFQELNRRKAVVFFHPAAPACCRKLIPDVAESYTEYDFDTARAITSFLINGTFSRFPDIHYIFCHSGGTAPVLAERMDDYFPKDRADRTPHGVLYEMKRLYYEVAHASYPEPLAALTKLVPTSQILFGSDYPIVAYPTTTKNLDAYGFSAADLRAINRGNAERLFPRLKA
jgi:predicted TIM-barrel fold metal-dependent hydrolase